MKYHPATPTATSKTIEVATATNHARSFSDCRSIASRSGRRGGWLIDRPSAAADSTGGTGGVVSGGADPYAGTGYRWPGCLAADVVQRVVQHPQESTSVKVDRVDLDRLSTGQGRQPSWQFLRRRHLGVVDENGNDSNVVSTQGGLNLEPYEVLWVIDASRSRWHQ